MGRKFFTVSWFGSWGLDRIGQTYGVYRSLGAAMRAVKNIGPRYESGLSDGELSITGHKEWGRLLDGEVLMRWDYGTEWGEPDKVVLSEKEV